MARPPALDALDPLRAQPSRAGVLTDFDGTLASIVDDPATARPLDGVREELARLADRFAVVAVLSGRPVSFLQQFLPPTVVLSGLYGLEVVRDGVRADNPLGRPWRGVIEDVVDAVRADGPDGMRIESKGLSLTLHYRGEPDLAPRVLAIAEQQAVRSGLEVRAARMSVELHPPIEVDKGTALRDLAAGLEAACFMGDDLGDLAAFRALDGLAREGAHVVRIAVRSEETPPALLEAADLVVDGPEGARDVLAQL
ncbi:MAG TPA: trehalose-phosphatase [Acidimicrobiales bacterium]